MFSGEKVLEDLRCDNSLMKTMVDRFGEDVTDKYQTERSAYLRLGQLFMRLFAGLLKESDETTFQKTVDLEVNFF